MKLMDKNSLDYAAYHLRKAKIIELKRDPDIPYMLIIGVEFNHWSSFSGFMHAIIKAYDSELPIMRKIKVDFSSIDPNSVYIYISRFSLEHL